MFIKIYFDHKPLFLCDEITAELEEYVHHDDAIFIDELDSHTVKSMIHEMQLEKVHAGVFLHHDLEELKKFFYKKFTVIQAGGGLVKNEKEEILIMFRRGKWDLPKGKIDEGETLEQCALREVEEETGLNNVELIEPLTVTYHTYHEGTKFILKESHWYTMGVKGKQELVPQTNEGISELKWVEAPDIYYYIKDAYPSVSDVLQKVLVTI
jgi:8-oxo-dGTP pyrophosphatase MutT (NUDIX family)